MSVAPGQPIEKSQLDDLAALANAKLTAYELDGILRDGDHVPFNADQYGRAEYIDFAPRLGATRPFAFSDTSGWRSELLRIRVNLRYWLEHDMLLLNRSELLPQLAVGGPWPIRNSNNILKVLVRDSINVDDTYYTLTGRLYDSVAYYCTNPHVTFSIIPVLSDPFEANAYSSSAYAITTDPVYRYDIFIPENIAEREAYCVPSDRSGMWLVQLPSFAPNMNPLSSATPLTNYDERILRFSPVVHRAMSPYAELPTPYPPAPATENASDYYEGLADYNHSRTDRPEDPTGPHSPSMSSYYRIPCYPVRKKSDGVYDPFASEAVSRGDFGAVIRHGMIYSVTMSRPEYESPGMFRLWQYIAGNWTLLHSETLAAGVRSETIYPRWPVFSDAPLYWDGPENSNVQATFVGRDDSESRLLVDVRWPIHSCYYDDTEALLNLL